MQNFVRSRTLWSIIMAVILLVACSDISGGDQGINTSEDPGSSSSENGDLQSNNDGDSDNPSNLESKLIVELTELEGDVLVRQNSAEEFASTYIGYIIKPNGQVQTMKDSRARIDFSDQSIVRVGPNSLFTFTAIEGEENDLLKRLSLQAGKLWIGLSGGEMVVETEAGVASVRGSMMSVEFDPITGEAYLACFEGLCWAEVGGVEFTLGIGETLRIFGIDSLPVYGYLSQYELREWLALFPQAYTLVEQIPGAVSGFVWEDTNHNGIQDQNEIGLPDVPVNLLSGGGQLLASTVTDETGIYTFEDILIGEYYLTFLNPENLIFTIKDEGEDDSVDSDADENGHANFFTLAPGEHKEDIDAGLHTPEPAVICPLTGLPVEDEGLLELRPLFISLSKYPERVRPLGGLSYAPVVFESVIDAGQTRLQALFYCGYPQASSQSGGDGSPQYDISAARSARVYYAELAQIFGAGLIYVGSSYEVAPEVSPHTCAYVSNTVGDIAGAGLDISRLKEIAETCKHRLGNTDLSVWQFGPQPEGGEPVEKFLMRHNYFNQTRWIYEPDVGGYVRYQNSPSAPDVFSVSTDRLNGQTIVRQNLLVLITPHTVLNEAGTIIEYELTNNGGYGYLLRDGVKYRICWSTVFGDYPTSSNRYRPFLIFDCATQEQINLAYGTMWVNVVDTTTGFEWKGEDWRAYHYQPIYQIP